MDKLIFNMENLGRRELHNIWGVFGGKYIPQVLYRVRMIGTHANGVSDRQHAVSEPNVRTHYAKEQ